MSLARPALARDSIQDPRIPDGFVLVERKTDEVRSGVVTRPVGSVLATLESKTTLSLMGSLGIGLPQTRTRLVLSNTLTSAANTALTTVIAVTPSACAEWSSFAALWSECKVHGGCLHYTVTSSGTGVPGPTVVSYDPMNFGALSSVASGCEQSQKDLRFFAAGVTTISPGALNSTGLFPFRFKCLKGSARYAAEPQVISGEWSATADASDTYGYLRPYVGAQGGVITSSLSFILELDVSFRSRS